VERALAPHGADRFYSLIQNGFYNNARVFRNVPHFVAQFGINGDPAVQAKWHGEDANIPDDPVKTSNKRGTVVFATAGPGTRTTQMFINTNDNNFLDSKGFSPIGRIVQGMDAVDQMYTGYGERPDQGEIQSEGNQYLLTQFPKLSYFSATSLVPKDKEIEVKEPLVEAFNEVPEDFQW